jgi:hypothetical protein
VKASPKNELIANAHEFREITLTAKVPASNIRRRSSGVGDCLFARFRVLARGIRLAV